MSAISTALFFAEAEDEVHEKPNDHVETTTKADEGENHVERDPDEDIPYYNPQTGEHSIKKGAPAATPKHYEGTAKHGTHVTAENNRKADERMYALKEQGYTDKAIADMIYQEGYGKLEEKTVATRISKFRAVKQAEQDEKLDDELYDWRVGEDATLKNCFDVVEKKYEEKIQKLLAEKWKKVSDLLAQELKERKYSAKACEQRFDGLLDGTALPPIELDPDQEGRKKLREARIAKDTRARAEIKEAARRAEEEKDLKAQFAKDEKERKQKEKHEQKAARDADKAEEKRIAEERRTGKVLERKAKAEAAERAKEEALEKKQVAESEDRVYRYYTGKPVKRKHVVLRTYDGDDISERDADEDYGSDMSGSEEEDEDEATIDIDDTPACDNIKEKTSTTIFTPAKVTKKTLLNPRSVMTMGELTALLHTRGLPRRGAGETHPQIVARLAAADNALSVTKLKALLESQFDKRKGNKDLYIERLRVHDAEKSEAAQKGIKSTNLEFKKGYEGYSGV